MSKSSSHNLASDAYLKSQPAQEVSKNLTHAKKPSVDNELINLDELLSDTNWKLNCDASALESKLQTELLQLESEIIHSLIESSVQSRLLCAQMDKAILKAEEIETWMSKYSQSLDSVSDQVNYIQQQNRPMLIQSMNQKALQETIQQLLTSVTLPPHIESTLLHESLESLHGVLRVEEAAQWLQTTMRAQLDPDFHQMTVVKDQFVQLQSLAKSFSIRLLEVFLQVLMPQADIYLSDRSRLSKKNQLKLLGHEELENNLAKYRGLMLWLQKMDAKDFQHVVNQYVVNVGRIYRSEIKELCDILRLHYIPKHTSEDKEYFISSSSFNSSPPHVGKDGNMFPNLVGAALSSKNTGTSSRGPHLPSLTVPSKGVFRKESPPAKQASFSQDHLNSTSTLNNNEEKLDFSSGFTQALTLLVAVIRREQNYFVGLFNLSGTPLPVSESQKTSAHLWHQGPLELEIKQQDQVKQYMNGIFASVQNELNGLLDLALRDTSMSIILMNSVEKISQGLPSHQEYLLDVLLGLQVKLKTAWSKFLQSQLRAIQEGRMYKRKNGVFPFIKAVPKFFDYMENALDTPPTSVRMLLEHAFDSVMKLVLESLETMADEEELVLENTYFLHLELKTCEIQLLQPHLQKLELMSRKHMENYVQFLIKKSFGKLQDFFLGIDHLLTSQTPEEVMYHIHYNRSSAKKIIAQYPSKELHKCLDYCTKKIQKHIAEPIVMEHLWKQIVGALEALYQKIQYILTIVYKDDPTLQLEFTLDEIRQYKPSNRS